MTLLELAALVERADGPDRELDELIGMAIGLKNTIRVGHECLGNDRTVPVACPHYTHSLDAAMTLFSDHADTIAPRSHRMNTGAWRHYCEVSGNRPDYDFTVGPCESLPLVICATALRVRSEVEAWLNQQ